MRPLCALRETEGMEILGLILAIGLFCYLLVALLLPEKFS